MSIRQFLLSTQAAPAERRAESAALLARAYLHGGLAPAAAAEARTALLALLDDGALPVRRSLAEAVAASPQAPRPLVVALASDHPDVACLVLARSPVLSDADLVDCAAIGCETSRAAIAGRADLSRSVAAALAEVAGPESLAALARNPYAAIGTAACLRMVERHGGDAALREALLARADLAVEVRHALAARVASALSAFGQSCGWLSRERGERVGREGREGAALALSDEAGEVGLARLVAHLRAQGQLTSGLILRAILSLRMPFAEAALADLAGSSRARVAGLMLEPDGAGFAALHRRAGMPPLLLPAIRAALAAWREAATGAREIAGPRLARLMIERALTACEDMPFAESRSLMVLLARFEAEAAREEARAQARATVAEAERREILRIEAAQRVATAPEAGILAAETFRDVPQAEILQGAVLQGEVLQGEVLQAESSNTLPDRLARVLDELPDAIVASYRAEQERRQAAGTAATPDTSAVLDGVLGDLPDALMASFLAGRAAPAPSSPEPAPEPANAVEAAPVLRAEARPRRVAEAVVAGMIPDALIASHRRDRERVRLAA